MRTLDLKNKEPDPLLQNVPHIGLREARQHFRGFVDVARVDKNRVVIARHNEPVAGIVPISDLRRLVRLTELWDNVPEFQALLKDAGCDLN